MKPRRETSFLLWLSLVIAKCELNQNETEAGIFLQQYNERAQEVYYQSSVYWWEHNTNITDYNQKRAVDYGLVVAAFNKEASRNASEFDWENFPDEMRRQFINIVDIGTSAMKNTTKLERMGVVNAEMESIYSKAKVTMDDGRELALEPGLTHLIATNRTYDILLEAWWKWRDASGQKIKSLYEEFVELSNEAIKDNGYNDTGEYWRSWYETDNFEQMLEELYNELAPFYRELHAYTRRKLIEKYGQDKFPESGHIPAHLLGNMWGQSWTNIMDMLQPYDKKSVDVTPRMQELNYTALQMFQLSDSFFKSLGLDEMPEEFWNHSMIEKPDDRDVVCHASAWDFYNGKDFRVKQCTEITMDDLVTVHHEMGHIEYYLLYKDLPTVFRSGANPGFHEAVGDVMSLSVSTPKHLQEIGLLENIDDDYEADINYLLSMALDRVAFIPFGYLIDQWRWSVFRGETKPESYNKKWWELRCRYQGLSPPVERTENDFDPGAKYHIPGNTPYIRYFVSYVLQFQFHKAVCERAGHTGDLHKCDIYNSTAAGQLLRNVLSLGSSQPWPEALERITGHRKMNASGLLGYFDPLYQWLKDQNREAGGTNGWSESCSFEVNPTSSSTQATTSKNGQTSGPTSRSPDDASSLLANFFLFIHLCSLCVIFNASL